MDLMLTLRFHGRLILIKRAHLPAPKAAFATVIRNKAHVISRHPPEKAWSFYVMDLSRGGEDGHATGHPEIVSSL
ncbi:hypothetical protein DVJ77_14675 [Dyella tabacisoli]|uniref:Uncharacterized protein n=1 Tax=Dyella tabacisoli TaxID=2282381 RepID=A0A369UK71_9GAMM|nr:hypothetical protein DVJ77_14675 [Dyella tabacisoli]